MTSKTLQYDNAGVSKFETFDFQPISSFTAIIKKLSGIFTRSEIEKLQAHYQFKKQHNARARQDILQDLPLVEKQRMGMHHLM